MAEIALTPKERQALKARAHALKPVVLLGAAGLTAAVVKEIDRALAAHELIKIRVPGDDRSEREAMWMSLAGSLSAARVQAIGKLLVLYRPNPEDDSQRKSANSIEPRDKPASRADRSTAVRQRSRAKGAADRRKAPKRGR